jgi:hypothetical protein
VATEQTATDSVTLAKMFVAQGDSAQAAGNSVSAASCTAEFCAPYMHHHHASIGDAAGQLWH